MASLALQQSRNVYRSSLSIPLFSTIVPSTLLFAAQILPHLNNWSLQALLEVFPPIVLAVPKKKTSHSRKAMRSSNKGLKDKQNIVSCPGCGAPKLAHHFCATCYSAITRHWKVDQGRQAGTQS